MRADDDPEKQRMKGQTEVKHNLLQKYLKPWLFKITELNPEILYIDGFAGWGYYPDGSPGSPILAMDVVKENYESLEGKLEAFHCVFIEANENNYEELESAVEEKEKECPPEVKPEVEHTEFDKFAEDFLDQVDRPIPSFIFIDPFGFSGVPFEVVSDLINHRKTGVELFITFTAGKMAQFLDTGTHEVAITEILGTEAWKERISPEMSKEERAEELLQVYEDQLRHEADVEFVWPFQMYEEGKRQTSYYLVHATNHFDGHDIMKKIMYKEGANEQFAYLGPDHYPFEEEQLNLTEFGNGDQDERIESFADQLFKWYRGESTTLKEVIKETTQETPLIEKHYRKACKHLRDNDLLEVTHRPDRPEGNKERGIGLDDDIDFLEKSQLDDF